MTEGVSGAAAGGFAVSIDLDPLDCYRALYGLPAVEQRLDAVYTTAVARFCALMDELGARGTLFAVGRALAVEEHAGQLRAAAAAGHEIGNHSFSHGYDLWQRAPAAIDAEVGRGAAAVERAVGRRPLGFRAPGYLLGGHLLERLARAGYAYDASVLPSPAYPALKAAAWSWLRLRGRPSAARLGDPREALGPAGPYRPDGRRPWRRGSAPLLELPVGRLGPLPLTGGLLALAGPRAAAGLGRLAARSGWVQLELHGVDLLDIASDRLDAALGVQPDLRIRWPRKAEAVRRFCAALRAAGRRPEPLDSLAARVDAGCGGTG